MTVAINPQRLHGNWRYGWVLDVHTLSSKRTQAGGFANRRSEIGELLYQYKYRSKLEAESEIVDTIVEFLRSRLVFPYLTAIMPIPPSDLNRTFQPVVRLALQIGDKTGLFVTTNTLLKIRETAALKNLESVVSRREELMDAFEVRDRSLKGKYVLLLDDIYRSGETMRAATQALYEQGKVGRVYVLALTRTRTKR